ncbi:MAG: tetratricopeptide repeat protein [Thermodesulfobacteriota bacterium]
MVHDTMSLASFTPSKRACTLLQGICRVNWTAPVFVFFLALTIRIIFLNQISRFPLFYHAVGDPEGYVLWAKRIAAGDFWGDKIFYQAPLYPYFLALVYAVKPLASATPQMVQAVLDALACALAVISGRIFFSRAAGLLAGLMLCFFPMSLFFIGLLQKTTLTFFFFSALIFLLSLCQEKPTFFRWLFSGACLGLLVLCRENALALFPVVVFWLFVHFARYPRKQLLAWYIALCAGLCMVLLPVAARNKAVGGAFVLTTSQFGANFYYGNGSDATGIYEPLSWGRASWRFEQDDARAAAEAALGRSLTPQQVNRYWTSRTFAEIRRDPLRWVRLLLFKSVLVLNNVELGDTQDVYTQSRWSRLLSACLWALPFATLLGLSGFGLAVTAKGGKKLWILYALFATFWASVALFFYFDRYRFPLAAVLALFAGGGIAALQEAIRDRRRAALMAGVLLFFLGIGASRLDLVDRNLLVANTYRNMGTIVGENHEPIEAEKFYQQALLYNPFHAKALEEYGELLEKQGRTDEALDLLHRAIKCRDDFPEAHWALGAIMLRRGNFDAAAAHFLAVSREPRFREKAYEQLGRIVVVAGNAERIGVLGETVLASGPERGKIPPELGEILRQAQDAHNERALRAPEK